VSKLDSNAVILGIDSMADTGLYYPTKDPLEEAVKKSKMNTVLVF
jgi:hypothetical protein